MGVGFERVGERRRWEGKGKVFERKGCVSEGEGVERAKGKGKGERMREGGEETKGGKGEKVEGWMSEVGRTKEEEVG